MVGVTEGGKATVQAVEMANTTRAGIAAAEGAATQIVGREDITQEIKDRDQGVEEARTIAGKQRSRRPNRRSKGWRAWNSEAPRRGWR